MGPAADGDAGEDVARASGIAMERYGLNESGALALMARLATRKGVALGVVALAIIAASRHRAVDQ